MTGVARLVAAVAVVIALAALTVLAVDAVKRAGSAAEDERLIAELEAQTGTDPTAAERLDAERERQTKNDLARDRRRPTAAATLAIAMLLLVFSARAALPSPSPPSLDRLRSHAATTDGRPPLPISDRPEPDLAEVDQLVIELGPDRENAIEMLSRLQEKWGWLPPDALRRLCETTEITPAQLTGVGTFYARFRHSPVGRHTVQVCHGTACHVAGADHVTSELIRRLEIPEGDDTDPRRLVTIERVACLGCCSLAPVVNLDDRTAAHVSAGSIWSLLTTADPEVGT